jgi:hypothetical protein
MFISSPAFAEQWLEANNNAGGKIILLQTDCDDTGKGKLLLSSAPTGQTIRACWWYFAGMVQVVYLDGSTYAYEPNSFKVKESK